MASLLPEYTMRAVLAVILFSLAQPLLASPNQREAVALAVKGARYLQEHGKAALIASINRKDPAFNQGTLYLAMRDLNGITIAHPTTALIGKDLLDVPDADGKLFRYEMLALARGKGSGWVDYKFLNPRTGKVEAKTTYVLRVEDVALEAGVYKQEASATK